MHDEDFSRSLPENVAKDGQTTLMWHLFPGIWMSEFGQLGSKSCPFPTVSLRSLSVSLIVQTSLPAGEDVYM
jgi:hypothetical protein